MERRAEGAWGHAHVSSWGYACFLTVNATSTWGGIFPFLPLEFQTAEVTLTFFLAQARLRRGIRGKYVGRILFSPRCAEDARVAERGARVLGFGMPYRRHVRNGRNAFACGWWRRAARHRLCRSVHAVAALLRIAASGTGQSAPDRGHGSCAARLLFAVPCPHCAHGVSRSPRVRALVRAVHCALGARDAHRPAHVRRRSPPASARVPPGCRRLLAQRSVRGIARFRGRRHPWYRVAARRDSHGGEQRFYGGFARICRGVAGTVVPNELPIWTDFGIPRDVSACHHRISAVAFFGWGILEPVRGVHVHGVLARADAHDDAMRSGVARPWHQSRVHLRLLRRNCVHHAKHGGFCSDG